MNKNVLLCIFSVYFFSLSAMEQPPDVIKLSVEGKIYEITPEQAVRSITLANLLREHTDPDEPIPLSENITKDIFDYIYKDLVGISYDPEELSDEKLGKLFDVASYLDAHDLMDNYSDLALQRVKPLVEQETIPVKKEIIPSDITIEVDKKLYVLTGEQAKKSNMLEHFRENLGIANEPIPLSGGITHRVFDYLYKDFTDVSYTFDEIDDVTLLKLINAANYLDAPDLLTRYCDEFVRRITTDLTSESLYVRMLMVKRLLPEISHILAQKIIARGSVASLIKKISEPTLYANLISTRGGLKLSHDETKIIIHLAENNKKVVLDFLTNKYLGEEKNWMDVAFSSDSKKMITAEDEKVHLYDTKSNKKLWSVSFKGLFGKELWPRYKKLLESYVIFINFSLDDSKIIFEVPEMLIGINAVDGTIAWKQHFEFPFHCIFVPEISTMIVRPKDTEQKSIYIVNAQTGDIFKEILPEENENIKFSSDNKKIVLISKEMIKVHDLEQDKNFTWVFPHPLLEIPEIVISPNDRFFAVYAKNDFIRIGDMSNGQTLWNRSLKSNRFGWEDSESAIVPQLVYFSPDSTTVLLMSSKNIYLFNVLTGKRLWKYDHANDADARVYFSLDSSAILVQHDIITLSMLNKFTGELIWKKNFTSSIVNGCFLIDGSIIAVTLMVHPEYKILFYNVKTGQEVTMIEFRPRFVTRLTVEVVQLLHGFFSFSIINYNSPFSETWFWRTDNLRLPQHVKNMSCDQALLLYYIAQKIEEKAPIILSTYVYTTVYNSLPEEIKKYNEKYNKALGVESVMVSKPEATKSSKATIRSTGILKKTATEKIIKRYKDK